MTPTIQWLFDNDFLSSLDYHFARSMGRLAREKDPLVLLAAGLASRHTAYGHICLDINRLSGRPVEAWDGTQFKQMVWPLKKAWMEVLDESPLASSPERVDAVKTPLVVDKAGRIYLARYWQYQQRLVNALKHKACRRTEVADTLLAEGLARLFPAAGQQSTPDRQRLAAQMSLRHGLAVISGGPGTGKTSTISKILVLILEQALDLDGKVPRIVLTAPTGKAAVRLREAVIYARDAPPPIGLACSRDIKALLPQEAFTIHRMLEVRHEDPTRFRYHRHNPLPVDALVVDESSMVDLALMTKLVEAVPDHARLILLGDKDQLASVEAGAVFGDICHGGLAADDAAPGRIPGKRRRDSNFDSNRPNPEPSGVGACTIHLTHSYRFAGSSGIDTLARAINGGDEAGVMECLENRRLPGLTWFSPPGTDQLITYLRQAARRHFRVNAADMAIEHRFAFLNRFRILCAHRGGIAGIETINRIVGEIVREDLGMEASGDWYSGRPVMVVENDYQLNLFNGDMGVVAPALDDPAVPMVHFRDADGATRTFSPSRLPPHETVYAMTIHKSQGSEFEHVMLVLPEVPSAVLTRELLYTAVTRAKKQVTLVAKSDIIRRAVRTPIQRNSGLSELLRR